MDGWNLTYDVDEPLKAEVGSTVIIGCSYFQTTDVALFKPDNVEWYKCGGADCSCDESVRIFPSNNTNPDDFYGRVSLLEPNVNGKASILIRDIRVLDTGCYQPKLTGGHFLKSQTRVPVLTKKCIIVTGKKYCNVNIQNISVVILDPWSKSTCLQKM